MRETGLYGALDKVSLQGFTASRSATERTRIAVAVDDEKARMENV